MIKTIYQIGKEISEGRDPWEDILAGPKLSPKDEEKQLYVLSVEFDLDAGSVNVSKDLLSEFSKDSVKELKRLRCLKIQGGNNKSIYVTADAGKLEQLSKTLFGKPDKNGEYPSSGEFLEAIDKEAPNLAESTLYHVLEAIVNCRQSFLDTFLNEKGKLSINKVLEEFELTNRQKVALVQAVVTSETRDYAKEPIGRLEGYEKFIQSKFFPEPAQKGRADEKPKLCYATGEIRDDVREAEFAGRYNINKFFVKTTQNYATGFEKKNYKKNYQLSEEIETYLNRGSEYLLNNAVTEIAGVRHVIIPEFFKQQALDIQELPTLKKRAELLFQRQEWEGILSYLIDYAEIEGLYWLNFIGIDSDGNYFKVGSQIKDVSKLHMEQVFDAIKEAGILLRPWLGDRFGFNLYTVYKSIPVRKDKENVNAALKIFKSLLEQRPIDRRILFTHFKELVLCHRYQRYRAYANITPSDKDYFAFSVRDSVFRYLAFMYALRQLNLLSTDYQTKKTTMEKKKNLGQEIEEFLSAMDYSTEQRALFFLGRALNRLVGAQNKKGHKKNALDKLNYNGMDGQSIFRFANELFESGRHYDITKEIEWDWGRFSRDFKLKGWAMDPQEALFFILSGYAYGIKSKPAGEENDNDNQN